LQAVRVEIFAAIETGADAHTYALSRNSTYWEFFMTNQRFAFVVLAAAVAFSAPVFADSDPTAHEIYEAASSGHLAQAQQMVEKVLKDHPGSAEAHYVAAQVYAREGNFTAARGQLRQAEDIDPAGSYAKPEALQKLKAELNAGTQGGVLAPARIAPTRSSFPFLPLLVLVGAIGLIWMLFRRRSQPTQYPGQYPGGMVPSGPQGPYAGPPGYGPAGYGPGAAPMGGGLGSTVVGGLASGLAVGAGVVAGEELAHHFLDGDRREGVAAAPPAQVEPPVNGDMGGSDFGVNDPGSWDDSGSGSDGGDFGSSGGDDWT